MVYHPKNVMFETNIMAEAATREVRGCPVRKSLTILAMVSWPVSAEKHNGLT